MNADTIREQLGEIQAQLERVEAERAALLSLAEAYENWLRIYDPPASGGKTSAVATAHLNGRATVAAKATVKRSSAVKGKMSVRGAIREVLIAARGSHLHSAEIWRRAQALGATTDVSPAEDLVDLNLVSIRKRDPRFKKVGVRTFAFVEGSTVEMQREPVHSTSLL